MCWVKSSEKTLVPNDEWQVGYKVMLVTGDMLRSLRRGTGIPMPMHTILQADGYREKLCSWAQPQCVDFDSTIGFQIYESAASARMFARAYGWTDCTVRLAHVLYRKADRECVSTTQNDLGSCTHVFGRAISAQEMIIFYAEPIP